MVNSEKLPIVLINFKTAKEASGIRASALAKKLDRAQDEIKTFEIIIAAQAQDIYMLSQEIRLMVFSQHIDPISHGSFTGRICPEAIKESGATGTLLNHPERRIQSDDLDRSAKLARNIGLKTIVCASSPNEGVKLNRRLKPDFIAIESEKLIGKSVSLINAYPEIVDQSVGLIDGRVLFGAGIKSKHDVDSVLKKGGAGILVSSAIIKSSDPIGALRQMLD